VLAGEMHTLAGTLPEAALARCRDCQSRRLLGCRRLPGWCEEAAPCGWMFMLAAITLTTKRGG